MTNPQQLTTAAQMQVCNFWPDRVTGVIYTNSRDVTDISSKLSVKIFLYVKSQLFVYCFNPAILHCIL